MLNCDLKGHTKKDSKWTETADSFETEQCKERDSRSNTSWSALCHNHIRNKESGKKHIASTAVS